MVVAVYGTARVSIFVIGASGSGPLKASRSVRRGVWRPPCAWRVRSNPALSAVRFSRQGFPPGRVAIFLTSEAGRTGHDFQVHVTRRPRIGVVGAYIRNARHQVRGASQHPEPTSSHRVSVNSHPFWTLLGLSAHLLVSLHAAS